MINLLLCLALAFIGGVWVKRAVWMSGLRRTNPPLVPIEHFGYLPLKVSIIVPARNEEGNLEALLNDLVNQNYPNFEIFVVNDRSTDRTAALVKEFESKHFSKVTLVNVASLPEGWTGKNNAMEAGVRAANGDWFLFVDADTRHKPSSLSTALEWALRHQIDFLTLAPRSECRTFWEKAVQPLAVSSLALWFDPHKVNDAHSGVTLANGQFILVSRTAYLGAGGNASVKGEVVEDVALATKVREAGFEVRFMDGIRLYQTRMYQSLRQIWTGWTRILTYLFKKDIARLAHKIFLFACFSILPFLVFTFELYFRLSGSPLYNPVVFWLSAGISVQVLVARGIGNWMVGTHPLWALSHPLGSVVMVAILAECIRRSALNRPSLWRGDYHS